MPRPRKPRKPQNHERWLITYSDLITLLLVFFIIMYSMSTISQIRFQSLVKSLQAAMHQSDQVPLNGMGKTALLMSGTQDNGSQPPNPNNYSNPAEQTKANQQDQQQLNNLAQLAENYVTQHHLQNQVSIANESRGVQITMKDVALFDTGQAVLHPQAQKLIKGFIPLFKSLPNKILVEGYTDNQPITTAIYPSNWELSAARAMSVVHVLSDGGIDPSRLSGTGYGQYNNVAPNNNKANMQLNRRVNIVILKQDVQPGTAASQPNTNQ
ncbi:flagellar motor protein MotB [Alicyclobacillus dauci]|uniref:OmpA family protein n=1 Tax=Alicyclobacillus dauci TaxID=1475485 RepID=A0ABY6Z179_9BACL|nr:flagellar motor protein MotB [Alicyclobacillus dauci]WAH36602.1 OmpA family protein [Alicyclobacillus dauci]